MQTFVGGIQLLSEAGATWKIVPQVGDLTGVDTGFSTSLGGFSSKWSVKGNVFRIEIETPKGTTGSVGLPLPGNHTTAVVTGTGRKSTAVHADESGRHWVKSLAGGAHSFVVVGL